jgi:hypothetical protein
MSLLAIFLPLGCIETNLSEKPTDPVFDEGDSGEPPDTDIHDDTDEPEDTGVVVIPDETCDSHSFPATTLTSRDECEGGSISDPAYNLEKRWEDLTLGWMLSSPVMVNLTDDNGNGRIDDNDVPDVIAAPYTTGIYAMSGADGSRIWSVGSTQIEQSTPAVGDVDFDGIPDVFVQGLYGSVLISGADGSTKWTGTAGSNIKTYCGAPGIADFEGDGSVEIYFGRLILDGETGAHLHEGTGGQGTAIPGEGPISVAADIDLDGELELIGGNTVYDANARTICTASGLDGFPAVGNFDSDPEGEVLVAASGGAYLYDTDCSIIWTYAYSGYGGPPAIADVDGDGLPEAIISYQSGIAVLDEDGHVEWTYAHTAGSLYDGVSAYDFDADGDWEVVLNSPDKLILFDGDGDILDTDANTGTYTCGQAPTMADIDNDGHAEIAYSHGQSSGTGGGITVLGDTDGFAAALSVWNQHGYSITNIENDGQVPASPDVNWDTINNFRAGPPISYVFEDQNVVLHIHDVCAEECDDGNVTVWWSLGNDGTGTVTQDLQVEFWGVTDSGDILLHTETWTADLPPGVMSESVETELTGVPTPLFDVRVEVDGGNSSADSQLDECDETDNSEEWGAVVCL